MLVDSETSYTATYELLKKTPKINMMENILLDPYLLFCEVFTDELCKHIANETNNYYHQTLAAIQNKNSENINIFSTYIPKEVSVGKM